MTFNSKSVVFFFLIFLVTSLNACSIPIPTPSHSSSELQREPTRQAPPVDSKQEMTSQPNKVNTKWKLWTSGKTQLRGVF